VDSRPTDDYVVQAPDFKHPLQLLRFDLLKNQMENKIYFFWLADKYQSDNICLFVCVVGRIIHLIPWHFSLYSL
jgi:hypothetical protein